MATLEGLKSLFDMGFILEEEYLARRAEFGVPADEPATNTEVSTPAAQDTSSYYNQPPAYDPYTSSYNYNPPEPAVEPPQPIDSYHTSYATPVDNSTYYTPYDAGTSPIYTYEDPAPQVGLEFISIAPPQESTDSFTSSGGLSYTSGETYSHPSHNAEPTPVEAPTQVKLAETGESYSHVFTTPSTDESPSAALSRPIPYGKSLLVHRSVGAYVVKEIEPSNSIWSTLKSCGLEEGLQIFKCGTAEVIVSPEMYWQSTTHKEAPTVTSIEAGNIYATRERKEIRFDGGSHSIDERIIWRYHFNLLEKDVFAGSPHDIYTPPTRIPGVRLMNDTCTSTGYFDPRQVIEHYSQYTKKAEVYPTTSIRPFSKLRTLPTPKFLQWPLFLHLLRSTQAKVDDKYCRALPEDSQGIWERVRECTQNGVCYFTGEPAVSGSFLSASLHNEAFESLISMIMSSSSHPQGGKTIKRPPIIGIASYDKKSTPYSSSSTTSIREDERDDYGYGERIKYDDPTMKMSYGWPTANDLSGTATATKVRDIKPVSARRSGIVKTLVQTLSTLSGPGADIDTKVTA